MPFGSWKQDVCQFLRLTCSAREHKAIRLIILIDPDGDQTWYLNLVLGTVRLRPKSRSDGAGICGHPYEGTKGQVDNLSTIFLSSPPRIASLSMCSAVFYEFTSSSLVPSILIMGRARTDSNVNLFEPLLLSWIYPKTTPDVNNQPLS